MEKKYLEIKPNMKLPIVEISVPCNSECLALSEFRELLSRKEFKEQMEVIDSLTSLLLEHITTLTNIVKEKFIEFNNINIEALSHTIYHLIESGGEVEVGEKVKYKEKIIMESNDYNMNIRLTRKIDNVIKDKDLISLCDQIKYISEALWEHFNKNISRVLSV
jgi:hypothetical protein